MLALVLLLGMIGMGMFFASVYSRMDPPSLEQLRAGQHPNLGLATIVYTAEGHELTRYYRENRTWVSYPQLSPTVIDALVATEDHRFYSHRGVDWFRLFSSIWKTAWGDRQGGSTLTMQLARNYFPKIGKAPALKRKLYEVATALKTERVYLKHEIIEMYLNTVPFGYQAYGIETAAQTYFNKSAAVLTVGESATLIGMLKATTRYNPVRNPERSRQRRNVVLRQMLKRGAFPLHEFEQWLRTPLGLDFNVNTTATGLAPHFAEYVRNWLDAWARDRGLDLYADGLKVYTTLDTGLQELATAAVETQLSGLQAVAGYEWSRRTPSVLSGTPDAYVRAEAAGRYQPFAYFRKAQHALINDHIRRSAAYQEALTQGHTSSDVLQTLQADVAFVDSLQADLTRLETGLVALDPTTGRILAWVGGRDFARDEYDKVALAKRQPGSTFKPFVYAAALELGYSPLDERIDSVRTYDTVGPAKTWTPTNSGGAATGDTLTLRDGLAQSKNTITAQIMDEIGPGSVAHLARKMGIQSPLHAVPSLALGTSEVSLLELVSAYGPLANKGQYHPPLFITRIEDRTGRPIVTFAPEVREALSPHSAYDILSMMRAVIDEGTGRRIRTQFGIQGDVAGKTGTTQNNADGWFILLHPRLAVGAWVGFNDRQVTFRTNFWGQGGHNALYVVGDFFRRVLHKEPSWPKAQFDIPSGYIPPDSLRADSLTLRPLSPDTTRPRINLEDALRTVVASSLAADTLDAASPDTAGVLPPAYMAADSTRLPSYAPIDTTRRRADAPAQGRPENDLEQTMRRMLFPEATTAPDSIARRSTNRQRDPD